MMITKEELLRQYREECEYIAEECREEGYPDHGSNYELRCDHLWNTYYAEDYEEAV